MIRSSRKVILLDSKFEANLDSRRSCHRGKYLAFPVPAIHSLL